MRRFSKIFVLGAGAIGSLSGAFLSKKNDVTLIGEKEHIQAIKSKGLRISGHIQRTFQIKAETKIKALSPNSLILLTTKAHQSEKAIEGIKKLIKKDTVILILQNGLGQEELIKKSLKKKCQILRGITYVAAEFFQPGEIRAWPNKKTVLPFNANGQRIAEILEEVGLETELAREMKKEIWRKLIVNCLIGPLTALFQIRNNEIGENNLRRVRKLLVKECLEVASQEGLNFEKDFEKKLEEKISSYKNYSSMAQDIIKGRGTEIDFLNGKIIELAKKHHLETPANEVIYHLIKFLPRMTTSTSRSCSKAFRDSKPSPVV
jgi:2-dehydropantoate 2-reductase